MRAPIQSLGRACLCPPWQHSPHAAARSTCGKAQRSCSRAQIAAAFIILHHTLLRESTRARKVVHTVGSASKTLIFFGSARRDLRAATTSRSTMRLRRTMCTSATSSPVAKRQKWPPGSDAACAGTRPGLGHYACAATGSEYVVGARRTRMSEGGRSWRLTYARNSFTVSTRFFTRIAPRLDSASASRSRFLTARATNLVTRREGSAAAGPTAAAGSARRPRSGAGPMPRVQASRAPPLASLPRVPRRASAPTRRERPRQTQRGGVHRRAKKQKAKTKTKTKTKPKTKTKTKTARTAADPRRRGGVARGSARRGPRAAACGGT